MDEKPCVYKKSCGYDVCMKDACPDYRAKKRGEPFFGEEKAKLAEMKVQKEVSHAG